MRSDWYYCQEKGKTAGPFSLEDLRSRIRSGKLRLFDLIYREGEPGWRLAFEHSELRGEFKNHGHSGDKPWVCLYRKSDESLDFTTLGPFADEEVKAAIKAGELSYNDYIWREGFAEWKRIGGLEPFNPRLRPAPKPAPALTSEELLRGVVAATRERAPAAEASPPEASGEDLTKIVQREALPTAPPRQPLRVDDPDATRIVSPGLRRGSEDPDATRLVGQSPSLPPPLPPSAGAVKPVNVALSPPRPSRPVRADDPTVVYRNEKPDLRARYARLLKILPAKNLSADWLIVGGLVVAVLVVAFMAAQRLRSAPERVAPPPATTGDLDSSDSPLSPPADANTLAPLAAAPPAPPAVEEIAPPVSSQPAPVPSPAPAPALRPEPERRAPTRLSLSAPGGRIDIRTNGSADFPVRVQIVSPPGQVAEGPAYYRHLTVKGPGSAARPVELAGLNLPPGRYSVRVETGDLRKQLDLTTGASGTDFKQALARERKKHSAQIWQERLTLFRLAVRLEQAVKAAAAGQSVPRRGFESLAEVNKLNGAKYLFFDQWWELKSVWQEALKKSSPAMLERVRRVKEHMATFSVWRA